MSLIDPEHRFEKDQSQHLDTSIDAHQDDDHGVFSIETPLRKDAFDLSDEEKIKAIEQHFTQIMHILGLDLEDDSLKGTPSRVAKMYVKEIFSGLNPKNKPTAKLFDNKYAYDQMLVEKDITLYSYCEHHFVPIVGKVHIAYYSSGQVVGLSKLNRLVQYYGKRPQVQERLTVQIGQELQEVLQTQDVAIVIVADHLCVSSRGIKDVNSNTVTSFYQGKFLKEEVKSEFLAYLQINP